MKKYSKCGSESEENVSVCKGCGQEFAPPTASAKSQNPFPSSASPRRDLRIIKVLGIVCIVASALSLAGQFLDEIISLFVGPSNVRGGRCALLFTANTIALYIVSAATVISTGCLLAGRRVKWNAAVKNLSIREYFLPQVFCLAAIFLSAFVLFWLVHNRRDIRRYTKNVCIGSLQMYDGAKEQWALENKKTSTDQPTFNDLIGTDKYIGEMMYCPEGGQYKLHSMSQMPTCTVSDHTLP
jgi:hypothetical protein